jgi:hypothetical protein
MTAAAPETTRSTAPATALDKRRAKWLATEQIATDAEGSLARVAQDLQANTKQRREAQAALEAAVQRAAELKQELKSLGKEREELRVDRTRGKREVTVSRRRAKSAERRFERALVKDLVAKAKADDLAAHKAPAVVPDRVEPATPAAPVSSPASNGTAPRRTASAPRRRSAAPAGTTRRPAAAAAGRSAKG